MPSQSSVTKSHGKERQRCPRTIGRYHTEGRQRAIIVRISECGSPRISVWVGVTASAVEVALSVAAKRGFAAGATVAPQLPSRPFRCRAQSSRPNPDRVPAAGARRAGSRWIPVPQRSGRSQLLQKGHGKPGQHDVVSRGAMALGTHGRLPEGRLGDRSRRDPSDLSTGHRPTTLSSGALRSRTGAGA